MSPHPCRHCGSPLQHPVIDLGHQPPSNAYLRPEQLALPEITYPLQVFVCSSCWLVQLPAHAAAEELFTADYAYFSSTSSSWCAQAERFVAAAVERLAQVASYRKTFPIASLFQEETIAEKKNVIHFIACGTSNRQHAIRYLYTDACIALDL